VIEVDVQKVRIKYLKREGLLPKLGWYIYIFGIYFFLEINEKGV
jgi:hypothetical protein